MSTSQSRSKSFQDKHAGIISVALDDFLNELAARAQWVIANHTAISEANHIAGLRMLWNKATAARDEVLLP